MLPRLKSASVDLNLSHKLRTQEQIYLIESADSFDPNNEAELVQVIDNTLPIYFDLISKFQYQQACNITSSHKIPRIIFGALRLGAACESTYHLMTYLEPNHLNNCRLDTMYTAFIHLLKHMAKELHSFTIHPTHSSVSRDHIRESGDHHHSGAGSRFILDDAHVEEKSRHAETAKKSLTLLSGPLQYYRELLAQAADFFQLRSKMIRVYRSLACPLSPHHDYEKITAVLKGVKENYQGFTHPLLQILKKSGLHETESIQAALRSESIISSHNCIGSIVTLHELKKRLSDWTSHTNELASIIALQRCNNFECMEAMHMTDSPMEDTTSKEATTAISFKDVQYSHLSMPDSAPKVAQYEPENNCLKNTISLSKNHPETEVDDDRPAAPAASLETTHVSLSKSYSSVRDSLLGLKSIPQRYHDCENLPVISSQQKSKPDTFTSRSHGVPSIKNIFPACIVNEKTFAPHAAPESKSQGEDCGFSLCIYHWSYRFLQSLIFKFYLYFAHSFAYQHQLHLEVPAVIKNSPFFQNSPVPTSNHQAESIDCKINAGFLLVLDRSLLKQNNNPALHSLFSSHEEDGLQSTSRPYGPFDKWTAIFVYPSTQTLEYFWLDLIHQIEKYRKQLSNSNASVESSNKQQTYNIAQVDQNVYLCLIVDSKCHKIKSSQKFLEGLKRNLQHMSVFRNREPPCSIIGSAPGILSPVASKESISDV